VTNAIIFIFVYRIQDIFCIESRRRTVLYCVFLLMERMGVFPTKIASLVNVLDAVSQQDCSVF